MASTSPKATRTASQTPQRGRGRGRPRLYARGTSSNTRRKPSASASKTADGTPTSRRKTGYNNGYRPGGAGGGGRYVHPSTGQIIPAAVYKEIIKSAERGGAGRGAAVAGVALPMTPAPPLPAAPPSIGPDGVYKPREERSYTEFHPGFDIEQPLLALTAEEVDGENYKPPALNEGKSVKIVDIKEEDEMKMSSLSAKEGSHREDRTRPEGSSHPPEDFVMPDSRKPEPESAASPISPPSNSASASAVRLDIDPMLTSVDTPANDIPVFAPPTSASVNGMAIDPALAALTPPPIPSIETTVPIDPALAMEYAPAQTQTPAATPTEPANDETIVLASTPPPTTPAVSGISPTKRGVSDVPTLASLRAHRSNAGKPPPRPQPPPTTRKPRAPTVDRNTQEKLTLRAPSFRKIEPFKFAEVGGGVGSRARRSNSRSNVMEPISDKMIAVGYQQSAEFKCPDTLLRDQPDLGVDDELGSAQMDLVEYDMDEQDDKWLTNYNSHRMVGGDNPILPEIFEYVMTKTEKEWVSLERKMPKVQAKPHGVGLPNRRRSSGRTGEDEDDEGAEDSKCAICDDGECENANAIVFCDGCNLAVHQECYGVPYIPEGQWHCRKCQQIPRQVAVCTPLSYQVCGTKAYVYRTVFSARIPMARLNRLRPIDGLICCVPFGFPKSG